MNPLSSILDLLQRIGSYRWPFVLIELAIIWLVVYIIVRFVQGTRAAGALKGMLLVVAVVTVASRIIGGGTTFPRLGLLYDRFLALVAVGLVIIFQPELRRALVRLGETPFFRTTPSELANVIDEIGDACGYLSKSRFGALIVLERQIGLAGLIEGGTVLNADLSARLLQSIFFPGAALHDLAVVVRGKAIHAAGVQLPLADPMDMPDASFGSRHRAAVGLTKECDALVIVVSEETGHIRVAERGRLSPGLSVEALKTELLSRLGGAKARRESARQARANTPQEPLTNDLDPSSSPDRA